MLPCHHRRVHLLPEAPENGCDPGHGMERPQSPAAWPWQAAPAGLARAVQDQGGELAGAGQRILG
jgi:hypothetical protein